MSAESDEAVRPTAPDSDCEAAIGQTTDSARNRAIALVSELPDDCTWEKLIHTLWRQQQLEKAIDADIRAGVYDAPDDQEDQSET